MIGGGANLIGHSFGSIGGYDYTGCLEAFEAKYNEGIRTFEVDFAMGSDGKILLCHDWNRGLQEGINSGCIPTSEKFKKTLIYGKYTPLTFVDLLHLMKKYPDIWIVTDSKAVKEEEVRREFEEMLKEAEQEDLLDVLDRMVVQIYNENMYDTINEVYPFYNYIFTMYMRWYGDLEEFEKICKWCVIHEIRTITMWNYSYNEKIRGIAQRYNIDVYVHTENDPKAGANYLRSGVRGLYTDDITQEMLDDYSGMVKTVYFSGTHYNADDYVLDGISEPEDGYSWTDGKRVYFYIPVERDQSDLKVEIAIGEVLNGIQQYEIIQSDSVISSGQVSSGDIISFEASVQKEHCVFEMILPDIVAANDLNGEDNMRYPALQLKQVTLYEKQ